MSTISAIRGMNDILPEETPYWQALEQRVSGLLASYGYREIRLPVVEQTALFSRSIGEVTDIVEKEMYSFDDRNGKSLTLRPEGTAGCVRAAIQNGLLNTSQKLWYAGPMFRYERPQKGRQRQFHQVGVEAFGIASPDIDAELILLSGRLWRELGLGDSVELQLNSIGSNEDRAAFRNALVAFLEEHRGELDDDSQRRLDSNPLRILDSKNVDTQALLAAAPVLTDYLSEESLTHFSRLRQLLAAAGQPYTLNPRLVRGLDYYNNTVFEWVTDRLGAQGTICAGGRYDGLVNQLGGKPVPGIGFAMGMERLVLLLAEVSAALADQPVADVYAVAVGELAEVEALKVVESLRDDMHNCRLSMHVGGGSFKSQMKKADRSGARFALIWGEDEVAAGVVTLKSLRGESSEQRQVAIADLADTLRSALT